jgi:hypothetical protein
MNWVVIATAPDQMAAEMWLELLKARGITGRLHAGDVSGFLGVSPHSVRIVVAESDAEEARGYLDDTVRGDGEEDL